MEWGRVIEKALGEVYPQKFASVQLPVPMLASYTAGLTNIFYGEQNLLTEKEL